jgi:hypothetical protein
MNHKEFAKLVAVYGLPVPWLATHVADVSERTFRYWVSGRPSTQVIVPADVVQRMRLLNTALKNTLKK